MTVRCRNAIRVLCLFLVVPCFVLAQPQEFTQESLWLLKPGWWASLTTGTDEEVEGRLQRMLGALYGIDMRVPEEERSGVRASVERIALNSNQYLTVRKSKGWLIEQAPVIAESYTIEDFLLAAKEARLTAAKVQEGTGDLSRLMATRDRMQRQIDGLYNSYSSTPESSLQRTLAGLNLMVYVTNRTLVEEKARLAKEQLAGIEQKLAWHRSVLAQAMGRLRPAPLEKGEVDGALEKAQVEREKLDSELLQIETELATAQTSAVDSRVLNGISKRVALSRARVAIVMLNAKWHVFDLFTHDLSAREASQLLEESKVWERDLDKAEMQIGEWRGLIRREQDAAERTFLKEEAAALGSNGTRYKGLFAHQSAAQEALLQLRDLDIELFQARQLGQIVSAAAISELDWFSGMWKRSLLTIENVFQDLFEFFSYPLFRIHERPVTLFKLLQAFTVFFVAYGLSALFRRFLTEIANRKAHISASSIYTFKRVAHYVILLIGLIWGLSTLGLDFSNLLIIAGALSVGIGFGLQGIVNNFLGGLIVLFDRKLRIGDFIELAGGEMGHITEVNVQNTVIRTLTGHDILVPNSDIITRQLTNWTLRDQFARFHIPFGVAYGSDKEKVKQAVQAAALKIDETVSGHKTIADPSAWLVGFGDSALNFELVVWVDFRKTKKRQSSLRAAYYWEIESALHEHGIEIPFPQRDLHLKTGQWTPNSTEPRV